MGAARKLTAKEPFRNLRYRIHGIDHELDLLDQFKGLKRYEAFTDFKHEDRDKFIRYIIYYYDPGSDLHREYPDNYDRKQEAAELAGFERHNNGAWKSKTLDAILVGDFDREDTKPVFHMIFTYLTQIVRNHIFTNYMLALANLTEIQIRLAMPVKAGKDEKKFMEAIHKKGDLWSEVDRLEKKIKNYEEELFKDDESVKEQAEKDGLLIPEFVADLKLFDHE